MAVIVVVTECEQTARMLKNALGVQHSLHFCSRNCECGAVRPDLLLYAGWDALSELMTLHSSLPDRLAIVPSAVLCTDGTQYRLLPFHGQNVSEDGLSRDIDTLLHHVVRDGDSRQLQDIQSDLHTHCGPDHDENGAMQVGYDNFASIYRFAEKQAARTGHDVQTLLLTLTPRQSGPTEPAHRQRAMALLSTAIQMTLRKNDVLTGCSQTQMLVLLVDADDDGGHLAANRIVNTFLGMYEDADYELHYDIRPIAAE